MIKSVVRNSLMIFWLSLLASNFQSSVYSCSCPSLGANVVNINYLAFNLSIVIFSSQSENSLATNIEEKFLFAKIPNRETWSCRVKKKKTTTTVFVQCQFVLWLDCSFCFCSNALGDNGVKAASRILRSKQARVVEITHTAFHSNVSITPWLTILTWLLGYL